MTANDALAAWLDEHLQGFFAASPTRTAIEVLAFCVRPCCFLYQAAALNITAGNIAAVALDAAELVPDAYRAHLRPGARPGPDVLQFRGGRLEIRG